MAREPKAARKRLIAAADMLFYSQSIRAVSVDAIAEAAGVTKRTLYYHFASKDDLIAAYLQERDLPTLEHYKRLMPERRGSAARQIRQIYERLGENAKSKNWRGCSFLRAAAEFANLPGHPARTIAARHKKRFEAWLSDILGADGIMEASALARQLMIMFDGAVAQILIHRDPSYAGSAADAATMLIDGARRRKSKSKD